MRVEIEQLAGRLEEAYGTDGLAFVSWRFIPRRWLAGKPRLRDHGPAQSDPAVRQESALSLTYLDALG